MLSKLQQAKLKSFYARKNADVRGMRFQFVHSYLEDS
jgi:hypothetical protein